MFQGTAPETRGDGTARTTGKPFAQQKRRGRRLVVAGLVAAAALVVASAAQARALTLATAGSPGPWLGSYGLLGDIYCMAPDRYSPNIARWFQVQRQEIGRSPLYSGYNQDIWMQARIQWSSDTFNWYTYQTHAWQKQTVPPGYSSYALFGLEEFDVTPYPGLYWRTRLEFRWSVAGTSTWLGTAIDTFNEYGITSQYGAQKGTLGATGEGVCYLP